MEKPAFSILKEDTGLETKYLNSHLVLLYFCVRLPKGFKRARESKLESTYKQAERRFPVLNKKDRRNQAMAYANAEINKVQNESGSFT